jgi:hypothetical protein
MSELLRITAKKILPEGKASASYTNSTQTRVAVGTYFSLGDHPKEEFESLEIAKKALDRRRRWLNRGARSLEIVGAGAVVVTAVDALRSKNRSIKEATLNLGSGIFVGGAAEVGSYFLRRRERNVIKKRIAVENPLSAVLPEPKPRS